MASNTHEFQFAVPTCEEHSNEEVFSYCNTCQKKICELCVKGSHNSHDWSTISKHARKIRNEGTKISEQIMKEIVPSLRSKTSRVRKESNSKDITQTQQTLKESIDIYASQLLSAVVNDENNDDDLEGMIGQFMKISDFFRDNIHLAHDNVVVDMKEEYDIKIEEYQQFIKKWTGIKIFKKGSLLEGMFERIFGQLVIRNPDARLVTHLLRSFTFGTQAITGVAISSIDMAWIHIYRSSKNLLLTEAGKSMREVDCGENFNSFIVKGKSHVFTSSKGRVVNEFKDGKLSEIYNTSPFYPTGLSKSRDGCLLVCLIECNQKDINHKTKGEVHHIDMIGNIIKKYVTDKDTKSSLFTWPNRVAQNVNLDICVLDFINENINDRLVVLSVDGRLRFIYTGQPKMKERFAGGQVVCDEAGRIFVADNGNGVIHALNSDGHFLQSLMNIHKPCSLSIYKNKMWIVCGTGEIKIFKVNEQ